MLHRAGRFIRRTGHHARTADNPPRWGANVRLERVAAVGALDGPPEYVLGRIGYLAALADGSFFVYDDKDIQIRLYDRAGKFVSKVGLKGDGPGEYRLLMGMDVVGDSLVTWDVRNNRISYFSRSGKFVSSVTLARAGGSYGDKMFGADAKGRLYLRTPIRLRPGEPISQQQFVVYSPKGDAVDSIRIAEDDVPGGFVLLTTDGARRNYALTTVTSLYPPGGVIEARTDRYAITVSPSASGKPMVIERKHEPVALRDEERREWEAIRSEFANRPVPPPRPNVITPPRVDPRPVPAVKPVVRDVYGDVDGRIWAEVYVAAEKRSDVSGSRMMKLLTWRERTTFDVFGRDGGFLGRVQLPQQSILLSARGNQIWVGTVGESDEPMIVSYRIAGVGLSTER